MFMQNWILIKPLCGRSDKKTIKGRRKSSPMFCGKKWIGALRYKERLRKIDDYKINMNVKKNMA
jgi:hypothetical protein